MDYMIFKENYYLLVMNINTKFLIGVPLPPDQYPSIDNTIKAFEIVFDRLGVNTIDNLRSDGDVAFMGKEIDNYIENLKNSRRKKQITFIEYLDDNGVNKLYTSKSPFTNKNRCIDRAIRTIRDIIEVKKLNRRRDLVEQAIEIYNNTPHSAYLNEFTPEEVQNNPEIEGAYIRYQQSKLNFKLEDQREHHMLDYEEGDILLVHVPKDKTPLRFEKSRRTFANLAKFIKYSHGNVICELLGKTKLTNSRIELPVYNTRLVNSNELRNFMKLFGIEHLNNH
jgi:hypothetical protein